jgi:hypothetical protein
MKLRDTSHDSKSERLAQRVAKLEEKLFGAMGRIAQLEEENARLCEKNAGLHDEVVRLQRPLAAARKNSSTSSKPPSLLVAADPVFEAGPLVGHDALFVQGVNESADFDKFWR